MVYPRWNVEGKKAVERKASLHSSTERELTPFEGLKLHVYLVRDGHREYIMHVAPVG